MQRERNWEYRLTLVVALCIVPMIGGGCQSFRDDREALAAYERTRNRSEYAGRQVAYEEEDEDGLQLEDFSPENVTNKVKSLAGYGPNQQLAQEMFDEAEQTFQRATEAYRRDVEDKAARADFLEAGERFFNAGKRWPESRVEQDGLFKAGESYFFADHYAKANECYELLVQRYPGSRYLDIAQARRFSIADYWLDLGREKPDNVLAVNLADKRRPMRDTSGNALRIYNKMRIDDPTGRLADDATMALANAYFEKRRFLDAADTYEDLRINFPTSKHQFDAHLLELRSRLEAYQGAAYDGTHLKKADKLLTSIMQQFPTEVEKDREELNKLAAEVRFHLAEREMKMARYYDYSGQSRSATIYYQAVIEKFPGTEQADEALARIGKLAEKPAKPKQYAGWLVSLFPEADSMKPLIKTSPTRAALQ